MLSNLCIRSGVLTRAVMQSALHANQNQPTNTPHELDAVSNSDQINPGAHGRHSVDPVLPQLPA
jgi:hypothetical protein